MAEKLYSVGLDVGTTSTQMILSRLTVQNQASGFAVPEMTITDRQILYRSPVHFTPLQADQLVDGQAIRQLILQEYEAAGITPAQVDTGAVIITGETSRKENAAAVLKAISEFAGDFVVATAGPDLESVLAAKGAGATAYSERTGQTVLHMDIGGGTSNMALIRKGKVEQTGCLNVGGRLLKLTQDGEVTYVSPVLKSLCPFKPGDRPTQKELSELAEKLCLALQMAAGRVPKDELLDRLLTDEVKTSWQIPQEPVTVSFSGGVADCIEKQHPDFAFGDLGVFLGRAIRKSSLCSQSYMLAEETIRATVIGAGCHSTQLSGSTVFCRQVTLPKKNLPVISLTAQQQEDPAAIAAKLCATDSTEVVLAIPGYDNPDYQKVSGLAKTILKAVGKRPVYVCTRSDMAKALGQCLSLQLPPERPCLCLDRLFFSAQSYLDVGVPVGPCFPVVIKTLVLSGE